MTFFNRLYHRVLRALGIEKPPVIQEMLTSTLRENHTVFSDNVVRNSPLMQHLKLDAMKKTNAES
jgi:hypothetical protein